MSERVVGVLNFDILADDTWWWGVWFSDGSAAYGAEPTLELAVAAALAAAKDPAP